MNDKCPGCPYDGQPYECVSCPFMQAAVDDVLAEIGEDKTEEN